MSERIQAIRGMNDVLPDVSSFWRDIEQVLTRVLASYAYQEIRLPLLESTSLFKRTLGEVTDVVEKEMYSFNDLNGESITLRPEGTAGCLRACLQHGLLHHQQQKLWYIGPMFRHERPQKGRYRQFTQLGVEALGISGVSIELELILLCRKFWEQLGLTECVQLQINTLGQPVERQRYKDLLVHYLQDHAEQLDEDSKRRLERNPLRILDSKNPQIQQLIAKAPKLIEVLDEESRTHFQAFCAGLKALKIPYVINPFLVRGLDYYGHTVFEWVTDRLGSQAAIGAGGRYDLLVEQLGGNQTAAVGFALGIERIYFLMEGLNLLKPEEQKQSLYIIAVNDTAILRGLEIAEFIRSAYAQFSVSVNTSAGSLKSQFKKADKSGARFALILAEDELAKGQISIKDLRQGTEQLTVDQSRIDQFLKDYLYRSGLCHST